MTGRRFVLRARVSTESPDAIRPILDEWLAPGSVEPTDTPGEFVVRAEVDGPSARELNRSLLSALRRAEKRTRLRAEWTGDGVTERFFDYVPKGSRGPSS
ncbi:MAG: hypothetical protein ACRECT_07510 [Thermoplasmata archaeon]